MNKKIKILLVALGILSLSVAVLSVWIYFSAQTELTRYAHKQSELERQNTSLQERLGAAQNKARQLQEKSEAISATLNELGREHTLLQSQYTSLLKERDSLDRENKDLSEQLEKMKGLYSLERQRPKIDTSDKFLSSLLEEKAALQVEVEKLRGQIEGVESQMQPSQDEFARVELEKGTLEKKLKDTEKVSSFLSNDLLQERKKRGALEQELARTEGRLREILLEKDQLAEQLNRMKQALEQRLAQLDGTKKVLESAVEGAKKAMYKTEPDSIELSPIVVKADSAKAEPGKIKPAEEKLFTLEGRIITVNDKHKFVVIDIGKDAGVEKRMPFDVYRQGEMVGKIEVIETRKNIAACDIKEMKVRHFKVSDSVRR